MTAGLQVFNSGGVFQIDENYRNLVFIQKYSFATTGDHTFTTPTGRVAPVLAFYSNYAATVLTAGIMLKQTTVNADGSYTYRVNGVGDVYLFDVPPAPSAHGQGLQVWRSNGQIAYDSGLPALRVRDVKNLTGPGALGFDYWSFPNQTISAAPGYGGWSVHEISVFEGYPSTPYAKVSAQKWAWIVNGSFSPVVFVNTHAAGGPASSPYGAGDGNVHKGLGAVHASGDNFVVNFRDIIYTGTYWNGYVDWSLQMVFVDVTGL